MSIEERYTSIREEIAKIIYGQDDVVEFALATLFSGGHLLLEGVPGTAKTLLIRTIAATLDMSYGRIQMTPDLLPNDITGSLFYNQHEHSFEFKRGPVFVNFLLADEINRASARTQSALLEAMQEATVTHDGISHALPQPFTVFATQNPIEQEGTYPLPLAQLDRFMFKVVVDFPAAAAERDILCAHHATGSIKGLTDNLTPVMKPEDILQAQETIRETYVRDEIINYVQQLVQATRDHDSLLVGASPRAGLMLLMGAKSFARFASRDFVIPDDIKRSFAPCMRHRIVLEPSAQLDGTSCDDILFDILDLIEVPR